MKKLDCVNELRKQIENRKLNIKKLMAPDEIIQITNKKLALDFNREIDEILALLDDVVVVKKKELRERLKQAKPSGYDDAIITVKELFDE